MARPGRSGRGRRERSGKVNQRPWRQVENPFPPLEILDEDGLVAIEHTALTILEEIGMDFLHPRAHNILRDAGADVEPGSDRVRFDRGLVMDSVAKAPARYTLHART